VIFADGPSSIVRETGSAVKLPPTVFIIDDDPAVANSLSSVLIAHGYTVECFTSANEFIEEQDPKRVGCVLVDLLAQRKNGSELLIWLHESGSLLSLVIISGLEPDDLTRQESTTIPFVDKPHKVSALLTMVGDGVAGSLSRHAVRDRSRLLDRFIASIPTI
jgi:FixJ family two-component response regulator